MSGNAPRERHEFTGNKDVKALNRRSRRRKTRFVAKERSSNMVVSERQGLTARKLVVGLWAMTATLFAPVATASGQQPATQAAPLYATNAKYVQGVGPGYWPTPGAGLTLNLAPGTAFCGGSIRTYGGGTLTMAASSTNYVYLDTTANCGPAANATGFSPTTIPIALATVGASAITAITDDRTFF